MGSKKNLPGTDDVMLSILKFLKDGCEWNYQSNGSFDDLFLTVKVQIYYWTRFPARNRHMGQVIHVTGYLVAKKPRIIHVSDMDLDVLEQKPKKIDRVFLKQIKGRKILNKSTGGKTQND